MEIPSTPALRHWRAYDKKQAWCLDWCQEQWVRDPATKRFYKEAQ